MRLAPVMLKPSRWMSWLACSMCRHDVPIPTVVSGYVGVKFRVGVPQPMRTAFAGIVTVDPRFHVPGGMTVTPPSARAAVSAALLSLFGSAPKSVMSLRLAMLPSLPSKRREEVFHVATCPFVNGPHAGGCGIWLDTEKPT
jgi:hypothetical protein